MLFFKTQHSLLYNITGLIIFQWNLPFNLIVILWSQVK
uniref:Uncharacterized protein n=1 Tax=Rhizophora mucronata TaxID=61149 RepID=A0A2P2QZU4_RHIMU